MPSYTEFLCDASAGDNRNPGDNSAASATTSTNGGWSTVTNIWTAASGTPFSSFSVGQFASLYADGATVAAYIARVTAIGGGGATLTLDTTSSSGTAPTTAGTGITARMGAKWKGPNGAEAFPFGFVKGAMTNVAGDPIRINFKNNATYSITAAMTHSLSGYVQWEGYTSSPGDGGRAIIDGGTGAGASYVMLTLGGGNDGHKLKNLIFANNGGAGSSGSASGVILNGGTGFDSVNGCVFHDMQGNGLEVSLAQVTECEAYANNKSNTVNKAAFMRAGAGNPNFGEFVECIAHDNTGSNTSGFRSTTAGNLVCHFCVADTNGGVGYLFHDNYGGILRGCEAYNNGSDGAKYLVTSGFAYSAHIQNCNFVKNGGWGINFSASGAFLVGAIRSCSFGSGTQANTSGTTTNTGPLEITGSVTLPTDTLPWVDAPNGDFRPNISAVKGAGRSTFTETAASYAGTVGFPDIGAAQHLESGGAGMKTHPGLSGGARG